MSGIPGGLVVPVVATCYLNLVYELSPILVKASNWTKCSLF